MSILVSTRTNRLPPPYCLQLDLEPAVGFEPTTDGLQNRCSTTELNWLWETRSANATAALNVLSEGPWVKLARVSNQCNGVRTGVRPSVEALRRATAELELART
jgi:hypothetical protein